MSQIEMIFIALAFGVAAGLLIILAAGLMILCFAVHARFTGQSLKEHKQLQDFLGEF